MATPDSNLSPDDKQLNSIAEIKSLGRRVAQALGWRIEIIVYGDFNTVTKIFNSQGELVDEFDSAGDSLDERWEWEVENGEAIPHYHVDLNAAIGLMVEGYILILAQTTDGWNASYQPDKLHYVPSTQKFAATPAAAICKAFLALTEYRNI